MFKVAPAEVREGQAYTRQVSTCFFRPANTKLEDGILENKALAIL